MAYDSINQPILEMVPANARSILDLGCGAGAMGAILRSVPGRTVVGVTIDPDEAILAQNKLDRVEIADLDSFDAATLGKFDCILCSHVLEHLVAPDRLLQRLRDCLTSNGVVIIALPNILVWRQRWQFLRGRFRYTQGGLMDSTHLRFFDWSTAADLPAAAGFVVERRIADGGFPLSRLVGANIGRLIDRWALRLCPGLFAWQFVLCCRRKGSELS